MEVSRYIEKSYNEFEAKVLPMTLLEIWTYLQKVIRGKHWTKQPWRPQGTNPTPLVQTWDLRDSVAYRKVNQTTVAVYTQKEWLAVIHEYWVTFRMTDKQRKYLFSQVFKNSEYKPWNGQKGWITIPARPIRRLVLDQEERNIENIVDRLLWSFFK